MNNGTPSFTPADKKQAAKIKSELDKLVSFIGTTYPNFNNKLSVFAVKLVETLDSKYWLLWDFSSQEDYLGYVSQTTSLGKTQLFGYIGVVRTLSKHFTIDEISSIGISKAKEIRTLIRRGYISKPNFKVNDIIREAALDKTISLDYLKSMIDTEYPLRAVSNKKAVYTKEERKKLVYLNLGRLLTTKEEALTIDNGLFKIAVTLGISDQPKSIMTKNVLIHLITKQ